MNDSTSLQNWLFYSCCDKKQVPCGLESESGRILYNSKIWEIICHPRSAYVPLVSNCLFIKEVKHFFQFVLFFQMTIKLLGRKYLLSYLDKKYLVNRTVKYFCWTRSLVEKIITETPTNAVNRASMETSELTMPMQMSCIQRKCNECFLNGSLWTLTWISGLSSLALQPSVSSSLQPQIPEKRR